MAHNNKSDPLQKSRFLALVSKGQTTSDAARAVGLPIRSATRYAAALRSESLATERAKKDRPFLAARREREERMSAREMEVRLMELEAELEMVSVAKEVVAQSGAQPEWLTAIDKKKASPKSLTGVPMLFASDWHFGENVDPKQINGVNEYSRDTARARARRFFERAIDLLTNHMVDPSYPGIVLLMGGDMVTGDIHEELAQTNDCTTPEALFDLFQVFRWGIRLLADTFGKVFLPCVTGNHGRQTHKMQHKGRNSKNWDWMLYWMLADCFKEDARIQFQIAGGTDAHFKVFAKRFCLSHGDQFRGGDGMIGALGPIMRGNHKKASRNSAIDLSYDVLLLGHWHQLIMLERLIVNGSLKGYDEYAAANNFGFEPPQQALFLVHAKHGITIRMPVKVDEARETSKEWISVKF